MLSNHQLISLLKAIGKLISLKNTIDELELYHYCLSNLYLSHTLCVPINFVQAAFLCHEMLNCHVSQPELNLQYNGVNSKIC